MKIPVILTCLLAVFLASVPVRQARADEVSFDVFYNNLSDDGDWYNTPEYGYVWQPNLAVKSDKWRPYSDGYWAQTDDGWTWVSYENFGWATYHYGRWTRLQDIGWAWVPGYDWGPGWVSWRTSNDYVGWAPLPPKVEQGVVDDSSAPSAPVPSQSGVTVDYNQVEASDYSPNVDVQYDIGPQNYCFVETRSFGAPVLAEVLLPPQRNFVIIERTVNVTNIYYQRGPGVPVVYNGGPDFNFINAHCERPIQQLRIERHEDVTFLQNGMRGGGNANQVRNGVFTVAAPPIRRGPVNFAQIKPVRVKQTLTRTQVVHGWSGGGADPAAVQRLHEQFKQQAQQAPPPRREPANLPPRANEPAVAHGPAGVPPRPAGAPQPGNPANIAPHQPPAGAGGAGRGDAAQREEREKAGAAGQLPAEANHPPRPAVEPAAPAPGKPAANEQTLTPDERKARRAERKQQDAGPAPAAAPQPAAPATADPDREARRAQHQKEKAEQATHPAPAALQPPAEPAAPPRAPQPQAQPAAPNPEREARRAQREQEQAVAPHAPQSQAQPAAPNPEREARRAQREQEQAASRASQPEPPHRQPAGTPQASAAARSDADKKKNENQ